MEYTISKRTKTIITLLLGVGVLFLILAFSFGEHSDGHLHNRFWTNFHFNSVFFTFVAIGATFFLAIQYAGFAGWSAGLLRVISSLTSFLPIGSVLVLISILLSVFHLSHIFHWMDPALTDVESSHYDSIIDNKSAFLNIPFFLIRTIAYIAIWVIFARILRRNLYKETPDLSGESLYKKTFTTAVVFIVLFAVTSSTSAWDWVMSIDPHWFSTLFGWYSFSSYFVSAIAFIILLTIFLKKQGYLKEINENHFHDLGKFLFAFSIFWTYLFFSQFMLIWYSNIPEEVVYFQQRIESYRFIFFFMLVINFILPLLLLVARPAKRNLSLLAGVAVVVLFGHWLDFFVLVTPGIMKENWHFGFMEIGTGLLFLGLFIWVIHKALAGKQLVSTSHPLYEESKHHHI